MRYASIVLAGWMAVVATLHTGTADAAARTFPYTAYVNSRDVYVRSGPGRDYYPTEKLQPGTRIEIYRHDPGGWYAIRPTKDSYSWVSSRYLKPTQDGLAEVTRDKVSSRVGSLLSNVRDVIQIRLEKGEVIEIRDEANFGGQTWYKIAPPAGEFRWISGRFVDRKRPHDGVSQPRHRRSTNNQRTSESPRNIARSDEQPPADQDETASEETAVAFAEAEEATEERAVIDEAVQTASREDESADDEGADAGNADVEHAVYWSETREGQPGERSQDSIVRSSGEAKRSRGKARKSPNMSSASNMNGALKQIDLQLSQMVAEEPTVWHFADMTDQLTELLEGAGTALDRGRVRQVLSKIATFEDIQARYQQINQVQARTDRANQQLDATRRRRDDRVQTAAAWEDEDQRFDGVGLLRPVVSRRAGAPRYALVDHRGDVLAFVTPAPGMNLQPQVGQRIGVTGTRGFMPDYNRPHVMVQRVTALDTPR